MGKHSKTPTRGTFRTAAALGAATTVLGLALTGTATADTTDEAGCVASGVTTNPDVTLCRPAHDDQLRVRVKVDPVLCAHAVVDLDGRHRLIGTRACDHHREPVKCVPCPGTPCGTPASTPAQAPVPVPVTGNSATGTGSAVPVLH